MSNSKDSRPASTDSDALDALRKKLEAKQKAQFDKLPKDQENSGFAEGLKFASEFTAAVFVGIALGWIVDKLVGTSPWGLLIGLFLGVGAGIMNVIRAARDGMDGSGTDLPDEDELD